MSRWMSHKLLPRRNRANGFARLCATLLALCVCSLSAWASPWGADYFPNSVLTTHDGKQVRFFDDVIKDKIVAINFIYTTCPDTCPLETAQLMKVQRIMGDRLGKDVFFYSITIDPEHDTPEVLAEYREMFGAKWTFLTGDRDDIIALRRKLGLYIEEIQDGSNNHNVSMIIGNQATGRWMKRSPFENPYVLADQLGNWLTGWKAPQTGPDYASAPKLRNVSQGEQLFRTRCATCHSIDGNEPAGALGPDLLGVTDVRDRTWLLNWLRAPDQMLAEKDPIAMALYKRYGQLAMPNMRLTRRDAEDLLRYMESETRRIQGSQRVAADGVSEQRAMGGKPGPESTEGVDVVAVMNAWIREAPPRAKVNGGYLTLVNVGGEDVTLVGVQSGAYEAVEIHEMGQEDGMMAMQRLETLTVPGGGQVKLAPGGKHLMLIGPRSPLKAGDTVELELLFNSGLHQSVSLRVAQR
jgi:copper(I)-binding protein/cytochrome oxidase Cu insertion factor (SCO1/SenC/PrrC family)